MPQQVRVVRLDDTERALLTSAVSKTTAEHVARAVRASINAGGRIVTGAATSTDLDAVQVDAARKALEAQHQLLSTIVHTAGDKAAVQNAVTETERALELLGECDRIVSGHTQQ